MKFKFNHNEEDVAKSIGVDRSELEVLGGELGDLVINVNDLKTRSEEVEYIYNKFSKEELVIMLSMTVASERYNAEKEALKDMLKSLAGISSSQSEREDGNSPVSGMVELLGLLSGGSMKRDPRDSGISLDSILGDKGVPGGRNEGSNSTLNTEDNEDEQ